MGAARLTAGSTHTHPLSPPRLAIFLLVTLMHFLFFSLLVCLLFYYSLFKPPLYFFVFPGCTSPRAAPWKDRQQINVMMKHLVKKKRENKTKIKIKDTLSIFREEIQWYVRKTLRDKVIR